jgi:hypothetical protein
MQGARGAPCIPNSQNKSLYRPSSSVIGAAPHPSKPASRLAITIRDFEDHTILLSIFFQTAIVLSKMRRIKKSSLELENIFRKG